MQDKEYSLAIEARDAREDYERKNFLFQRRKLSINEVMSAKRIKEQAEKKFREAVKKGTYHSIEQDLKLKYDRH